MASPIFRFQFLKLKKFSYFSEFLIAQNWNWSLALSSYLWSYKSSVIYRFFHFFIKNSLTKCHFYKVSSVSNFYNVRINSSPNATIIVILYRHYVIMTSPFRHQFQWWRNGDSITQNALTKVTFWWPCRLLDLDKICRWHQRNLIGKNLRSFDIRYTFSFIKLQNCESQFFTFF